jgi:hypothetical protein
VLFTAPEDQLNGRLLVIRGIFLDWAEGRRPPIAPEIGKFMDNDDIRCGTVAIKNVLDFIFSIGHENPFYISLLERLIATVDGLVIKIVREGVITQHSICLGRQEDYVSVQVALSRLHNDYTPPVEDCTSEGGFIVEHHWERFFENPPTFLFIEFSQEEEWKGMLINHKVSICMVRNMCKYCLLACLIEREDEEGVIFQSTIARYGKLFYHCGEGEINRIMLSDIRSITSHRNGYRLLLVIYEQEGLIAEEEKDNFISTASSSEEEEEVAPPPALQPALNQSSVQLTVSIPEAVVADLTANISVVQPARAVQAQPSTTDIQTKETDPVIPQAVIPAPVKKPVSRPIHGGLTNPTGTCCFFNAAIQALICVDDFQYEITSYEFEDDRLNQLRRLAIKVLKGKTVDPSEVIVSLGFDIRRQDDAAEVVQRIQDMIINGLGINTFWLIKHQVMVVITDGDMVPLGENQTMNHFGIPVNPEWELDLQSLLDRMLTNQAQSIRQWRMEQQYS